MRRLFIAVPLPENILSMCLKTQKNINSLYTDKIRLTPKNQLHLTLAFLGEMDDNALPRVNKAISGTVGWGSMGVALGDINGFPEASAAKVIIVELVERSQKTLTSLVKVLRSRLDLEKINYDHKPWQPHITIARAKQPVFLKKINPMSDEFKISHILLMESQLSKFGPSYFILNKYEL